MKIRDDLEGFVHVHVEGGVVVLKAGDTVPSGVEVGEHLTKKTEQKKPEPEKDEDDNESGVKRGRSRSTRTRSDS